MNGKNNLLKKLARIEKKRSLFHYLLWQLGYYKDDFIRHPIPEQFSYPNSLDHVDLLAPTVTWINHSTFLIKAAGLTFLTDPIWSMRCSPLKNLGPKRQFLSPISIQELPKIDYVLISHNHYDHLDYPSISTLHQLFPSIKWVIPQGVKKWFLKKFPTIQSIDLLELSWYDKIHIESNDNQLVITSVPAQHFSGRGLFDRDKTLWMGIVVQFFTQSNLWKTLYFAGDTGYNDHYFKKIGHHYGPIDLSIIPIGVYSPREFMRSVHVNPEESIRIHNDTNSSLSVGSHFGTFKLSDENLKHPPYDLYRNLEMQGIDAKKFRVLNPGQSINW